MRHGRRRRAAAAPGGEPRLRDDLRHARQDLPEHGPAAARRCRSWSGCCQKNPKHPLALQMVRGAPGRAGERCAGPALVAGRRCVALASGLAPARSPRVLRYEPGAPRARRRCEPILRAPRRPAADAFPEEKDAAELAARLERAGGPPARAGRVRGGGRSGCSAPDFKGGRLARRRTAGAGTEAHPRSRARPRCRADLARDRAAFAEELAGFAGGLREPAVAELLITAIEVRRAARPRGARPRCATTSWARASGRGAPSASGAGGSTGGAARDGVVARRAVDWRSTTRRAAPRRPSSRRSPRRRSAATLPFAASSSPGSMPGWRTLDAVFAPGGMGHHGVSVGDVDGDGLRRPLRRAAGGPAQPPLPQPGRRHVRGRDGGARASPCSTAPRSRSSPTWTTTATRTWSLVTRSGPAALRRTTARAASPASPTPSASRAPLRGSPTSVAMADYDRDGFLDLYLCTYSYFIGASEDKAGTAHALPRRAERPAQRALPQRRPRPLRGRDRGGGPRPEQRPLQLRRRLGRLRRRTAGPTSLVANDFGRKNLYRNEGLQSGTVRFKDVAAAGGGRGLRRGDERGLARLRQRRPPRHLHRQHVDGRRAARHRRSPASCPTPRPRCASSTAGTPAATRSSATAATARSRT